MQPEEILTRAPPALEFWRNDNFIPHTGTYKMAQHTLMLLSNLQDEFYTLVKELGKSVETAEYKDEARYKDLIKAPLKGACQGSSWCCR